MVDTWQPYWLRNLSGEHIAELLVAEGLHSVVVMWSGMLDPQLVRLLH